MIRYAIGGLLLLLKKIRHKLVCGLAPRHQILQLQRFQFGAAGSIILLVRRAGDRHYAAVCSRAVNFQVVGGSKLGGKEKKQYGCGEPSHSSAPLTPEWRSVSPLRKRGIGQMSDDEAVNSNGLLWRSTRAATSNAVLASQDAEDVRRAGAVVAALTSDYGIAAERLTAVGVGMAAPGRGDSNQT